MKTADVEIVMVPGWSSSGPDHWQSRWQRNLPHATRVEQDDWYRAEKDTWVGGLITTLATTDRPTVVVAHSLGVITTVHALQKLPKDMVSGAFLVAPADVEKADLWPETEGYTFDCEGGGFAPIPLNPLNVPTTVVASTNDPYCAYDRAKHFANAWQAKLIEAGPLGHINVTSGHGPWPEGLLRFGKFLNALG